MDHDSVTWYCWGTSNQFALKHTHQLVSKGDSSECFTCKCISNRQSHKHWPQPNWQCSETKRTTAVIHYLLNALPSSQLLFHNFPFFCLFWCHLTSSRKHRTSFWFMWQSMGTHTKTGEDLIDIKDLGEGVLSTVKRPLSWPTVNRPVLSRSWRETI